MAEYQWRVGFPHKRVDPQKVGNFLDKMPALTAESIVAAAQKPRNPMHRLFEWNDTTAAKEYRLSQARNIVGAVVVVFEDEESQERTTRAFVNITDDGDRRYRSVAAVMSDNALKEKLLKRGLRELQEFRERYEDVQAFADVFAAINRVAAE